MSINLSSLEVASIKRECEEGRKTHEAVKFAWVDAFFGPKDHLPGRVFINLCLQTMETINNNNVSVVAPSINDTGGGECPAQALVDLTWVRVILCLFYTVIFIFGFSGNVLVILVREERRGGQRSL